MMYTHTQACFNTMRYKGSRGLVENCQPFLEQLPLLLLIESSISRVNDHQRADVNKVQGEYIGVPGRREQANQWPRTYDRIQHSKDLIFKRSNGKQSVSSETPLNQRSSRVRVTRLKSLNWHKYHYQLQHRFWSWILVHSRQKECLKSIESVDQNPC